MAWSQNCIGLAGFRLLIQHSSDPFLDTISDPTFAGEIGVRTGTSTAGACKNYFEPYVTFGAAPGNTYLRFRNTMLVWASVGCPVATDHGCRIRYEYWNINWRPPYFGSLQKVWVRPKVPSCTDLLAPAPDPGKPYPTALRPVGSMVIFFWPYTPP